MAAYGEAVKFEYPEGTVRPLSFIAKKDAGAEADIISFDENGAGGYFADVPRNDDGGGRTWRP